MINPNKIRKGWKDKKPDLRAIASTLTSRRIEPYTIHIPEPTPTPFDTSPSEEEQLKNYFDSLKEIQEGDFDALDVAKALSKTFPHVYCLQTGLYWDDEARQLRWTSPLHVGGSCEPVITRSTRRALRRAIKKEKRRIMQEEKEWFQELYLCSSILQEYWVEAPLEVANAEGGENEMPGDVKEALERIKELLENARGGNFLLRYFIWLTNEIAREILENNDLREKCIKDPKAFTRDRDYPLRDMFTILLTMTGDNLNNEIYEYFKMKDSHPSPQAFVQRRNLITEECMKYFYGRVTETCKVISICMPASEVFSKFGDILSFDGSDGNIAYNPNDEDTFIEGKKGGQDTQGEQDGKDEKERKGWNQVHINAIFSTRVGMFVNALIQPKKKTHETQAAVEMIRSMVFDKPTVILGDRGYGCLNLIETIRRTENLDCVIRVRENWITEVKNLPMCELDTWIKVHVITTQTNEDKERVKRHEAKYLSGVSKYGKEKVSKVWDYASEVDVVFRVVRFHLGQGLAWETIVTTLDEKEYPIEKIKEMYYLRWGGIENAFRILKWDNHLAQMHCKKKEFSLQEIWARLSMFNIVSCVVNCAAAVERHAKRMAGVPEDRTAENQKHERIINRRYATYVVCDFLKNGGNLHFDVIQQILRYKVPVRAGRSFMRNIRAIGFAQFLYR